MTATGPFIGPQGLPNFQGLQAGSATPPEVGAPIGRPVDVEVAAADAKSRNRSRWISTGLYIAGGVAGGLARLGIREWLPTYATAANPLVNIGTQIAMSPGQPAIQFITAPLSVRAARWVEGDKQGEVLRGIDPLYEADFVRVFATRSGLDGWVAGPLSDFGSYCLAMRKPCRAASDRLKSNDVAGAARILGATLVDDRRLWPQHQPEAANPYELLFNEMRVLFVGYPEATLAELRKATIAEALRLDGGADKGLEKYVEAMMAGLTTDKPPRELRLPWGDEAGALAISDRSQKDPDVWARELIKAGLEEVVKGKGYKESDQIRKAFSKGMKDVLEDLRVFEQEKRRPATSDELWRMMNSAMAKNAGESGELKAALLSVGAFVVVAGGATFGYAKLLPLAPAWSVAGFAQVIPTLISYLTVTARFGLEKFLAFGRALGWAGATRPSLGKNIDRDFRNMRIRTAMIDRRASSWFGLRAGFVTSCQRYVVEASAAAKQGHIDEAAALIAGMLKVAHTTFFYFWPFTKVMHYTYDRLGPYFDGITVAQREELAGQVMKRLEKFGADKESLLIYHKPFIEGLLGRNVKVAP